MEKPLLILDLDETLIYSVDKKNYLNDGYDLKIDNEYFTKKRPYVDDFVKSMSVHYELAVWTAATEDYAQIIVNELFSKNNIQLEFFFSRERCIPKEKQRSMYEYFPERYYIKDLNKIKKKYNLERVLMVDDLPIGLQRQYGNLIRVNPFTGNPHDEELKYLEKYLIEIKNEVNFRQIEKRNWIDNTSIQSKSNKLKF